MAKSYKETYMQAAILAGGLGTRLRPITYSTPKAMVEIKGRPFLEYVIYLLRMNGVKDIVLCVGYLADKIIEHFGDGKDLGVRIRYSVDGEKLLGPAGALKNAEELLDDRFFVTYGDAYLRLDYSALMQRLIESGKLGVMAVYKNNGKYGKSDAEVKDGMVVDYSKSASEKRFEWINFGVTALDKRALNYIEKGREVNEEEFYGRLIAMRELAAFPVKRRFYEIGTINGIRDFKRYLASCRVTDLAFNAQFL